MLEETRKKLAALSVDDTRAALRWLAAHTESESLASFLNGWESRSGEPFDAWDEMLGIGRLMVKAGIGEGLEKSVSLV